MTFHLPHCIWLEVEISEIEISKPRQIKPITSAWLITPLLCMLCYNYTKQVKVGFVDLLTEMAV